ncbi:MAG: hypothetical protein A2Y66_01870 [Nitrospirae bacterium RBG_13_41_22]|nr:MAG: hypothetical protein A2Y66_01870 [Nitrospirae bacterium RBG_13_41_22]
MTVHHQDNSYLTTQQLTTHRHQLSHDKKQKNHIIDQQTISDIMPVGLKRFIMRLNKTNKLQRDNHASPL